MGGLLFTIVSIASIYWLMSFVRASNNTIYSRREPVRFDQYRSRSGGDPIVTPVDEAKKIPARLPQISVDDLPTMAPPPVVPLTTGGSANFATIPTKIEESLLFRSLTLAMFVVGIVSVDCAAGTHFSWVGIPFVTMGTVWSWYRRHYAKHWLNIAVSVASSIGLGLFIPSLFDQISSAIESVPPPSKMSLELALTLGAIVIAVQMGLSFHLYSRRVLGYCLLISGILMGVAAGWSQNIGFLMPLCGSIALTIPTLMLDYRSRLALQPIGIQALAAQGQLPYQHLPWQYLAKLAAMIIGLGMMLSVFLPNFRLPNLAISPPGLEQLQKYRPPNHSPAPTANPQQPPAIDRQELAHQVFGQAGNHNYPDSIKQENLQLPPELAGKLQQFTQQILATSSQPLNSDFDRATYLADYLKQHHQAAPAPANPANLPPLDAKSIQALIAKCAATPSACKLVGNQQDLPVVYTAMLRSIGIPARIETGEQPASIDPQTKLYPRPADQLASKTEMYAPNWGWVALDATPDRPVINFTPQQLTQLQAQAQQQPSTSPAPATNPTPQSTDNSAPLDPKNPPNPPNQPAAPPPNLDPNLLKAIAIFIAIGGGIMWYLLFKQQQHQQLATLPPVERIYRSTIASLSKTGNIKAPAQTQLEYARSIETTEHPQIAKVVTEISQLYTAWRYGHQQVDIDRLTNKLRQLQQLQQVATTRKRQKWLANHRDLWLPGNTRRK